MIKMNKYEIAIATENDSDTIKYLFEHTSFNNLIDLQFRRGDNPYKSFMEEDAGAVIILLKDNATGKAIGMGACSFHDIYLNGEIKRGGYLNGLKILPEYRTKLRYLPQTFQLMNEVTKDQTDIYYATVLQLAKDVQNSFEKKRKSMPTYAKQCIYTSFLFNCASNTRGLNLEKGNVSGLDSFYEKRLCQYNLAPVKKDIHGLRNEDFITWRDNGKILASCAIINNQSMKNYFLKGYSGIVKFIAHFPMKLIGLPPFPKVGKTVDNLCISMLMFDDDVDLASRARFIRAASSFAKGCDVVTLGLTDTDPTYRAFKKISHIKYSSYLYTINYDEIQNVNSRPVYLDVTYM